MAEVVDISEDLPSGDDSAFTSEVQQTANAVSALHTTTDHVFVATSRSLLTTEQLHESGIKTTHIVIHDQTLESGLKTPITPLTPATPLSTNSLKDTKFKYNWDESVHDPVLPVRCKHTNGELHKLKFGSGGRGRCIKVGDVWYTPSEFETACGRASSKDWKRSIRYGGRTLQCLIEEGILQPHATSCTCAACCDDVTVTGPVRLFVPYKRRRRDSESGMIDKRLQRTNSTKSSLPVSPSSLSKDAVVVTLTNSPALTQALSVNTASTDTIHVVTPNLVDASQVCEAVVMTPLQQTPKTNSGSMDFNEQKQWWQLEEVANSLLNQVHQLKNLIELAKQQSIAAKEMAIQQVKIQMENEKKEALSSVSIETQMQFQRAIEAREKKDLAIQQALAQAQAEIKNSIDTVPESKNEMMKVCANCDREAFSECTGCHRVSYCGSFCQRKDWPNHQNECGQNVMMDGEEEEEDEEDSDKDKD